MSYEQHKATRELMVTHYDTMSNDSLRALWLAWYPLNSKRTSEERMVCGLLETVARLRGFDIRSWTQPATIVDFYPEQ